MTEFKERLLTQDYKEAVRIAQLPDRPGSGWSAPTIAELVQREKDIDADLVADLAEHKISHSSLDFDLLIPEVPNPRGIGRCETCGCATVLAIYDGFETPICKDCVNCLKYASLVHTQPVNLPLQACYECRFKFDAYGIIRGATHLSLTLTSFTKTVDGVERTFDGLEERIAAGKVLWNPAAKVVWQERD